MNDILHALDNGDVTVVTLLDLSAAFDTIDHNILCQRLESGTPLDWFRSYLSNRTHTVTINNIIYMLRSIECFDFSVLLFKEFCFIVIY